jgi:ketosteroid isomerase-like protein
MSQENVEIVRRAFEAFAAGDAETLITLNHPDARWALGIAPMLGMQEIRGEDAVRRFLTEQVTEGWDEFSVQPLDFQDHGELVIVPVRMNLRTRSGGLRLDDNAVYVVTVHDGKIAELREYDTEAEAVEAVRLQE